VSNFGKAPHVTTRIKKIVRFDDDDLFHLFSAAPYIHIILVNMLLELMDVFYFLNINTYFFELV